MVPISVITSILLKSHRLNAIPEQLRMGSQSRKCYEIIQWKQRVQKLRRWDVEATSKYPRGELIDISSILTVESTSKFPRRIDVTISTWIHLAKSMSFRRTFHVVFGRRIEGESTRMCPLGIYICSKATLIMSERTICLATMFVVSSI